MSTTALEIQTLYVAYFNRPADKLGLDFWIARADANGGVDSVASEFANSTEYTDTYGGKSPAALVNQIYLNLFGRPAETEGLIYWANKLINKEQTFGQIALTIANSAQNDDLVAITNKVNAADAFTTSLDTATEILGYDGKAANQVAKDWLAGITDDASFAAKTSADALNAVAKAASDAHDGTQNSPQTFVLTKGLDTVNGGAGNDVIVAAVDSDASPNVELNTLSSLDIINGGAGIDTLKIVSTGTNGGTINLPNLTSVEIVTIDSAADVAVNSSSISDITNLNVTKASGVVTATAAATTSVDVSVKNGGAVTINGGKDVNVALTDRANNTIDVGATGTDPVGNVTIDVTGKAAVNNATTGALNIVATQLGNINVGGGKTVSVTQHATSSTSALVADGGLEKIVQGNVTVTASSITTDVTVKQDAQVDAASRAAVVGVTEVASVKFSALASGELVTVGGLTFTASKDLTAAQVAQAFNNLTNLDTQGSGVNGNGTFTGQLLQDWSSGTASADGTVVFTGKANTFMTDLVATAKATVTTTTQGVTAVSARNTLGIDNGTVAIAGGAALKNVTVDGYADSIGTNGVTGTAAALDTVKLANGGSFDIDSAAATLSLTATNVGGTVNVIAGTKTINAVVTGADATTTLASASADTVNVSGSGNVAGTTANGGLNVATAINTSGMTAGTAKFTIADGTFTTYTGGAGSDSVIVSNAGTAITKAINLGAGDDVLTLQGTVVVPTATLSGGAGTDTIAMNGASAASLSANGDFAAKIDGFEKLAITDTVTIATTVNMANMDGITYVVSNNSGTVSPQAVKQVFTVDFAASGAIVGNDSVSFDGRTVNLTSTDTPATIAAKFLLAGAGTAWDVTNVSGSVVTFTAKTGGVIPTPVAAADFVVVNDTTTASGVVAKVQDGNGAAQAETFTLDLTGSGAIEAGDTIQFDGQTITLATGDTAATIANKVAAATYADWTATANSGVVTFVNKTFVNVADTTIGNFQFTNVKGTTVVPGTPVVTTVGAAAGNGSPALTIDKLANNGTVELVAGGAGVVVKLADATGSSDSFNLVTKVGTGNLNFGTVDVAGVETIKFTATDTDTSTTTGNGVQTSTVTLKADKAAIVTIDGSSNVNLTLDTTTNKLVTINASALTGGLTVDANNVNGANALTINGGAGNDTIHASVGANAKADIINGGAGNDTIYAGSNGATLTGGAGNDTFILSSASATGGTKEGNAYSTITDFSAGDVLKLQYFDSVTTQAAAAATGFAKLTAVLNDTTASFSNFLDAAVVQAGIGGAVYFNFKGDTYVVVDSDSNTTTTFHNEHDLVIKLTGVNGDSLTWNSTSGTVALA
ncbi:DUF4214 domain-containing protein [Duganella sp. FT50W]|uniref:DUF4214 domain-containing protein n=1 Tax=Duganella lactea TaxID=2692173 RepID=A0A6L8MSM8_9BURK|nr:DUF4214 domain-containing protein [Duganella lactea]MYM85055.1 DUF4214 domain-containing protein [Duganella lactea]